MPLALPAKGGLVYSQHFVEFGTYALVVVDRTTWNMARDSPPPGKNPDEIEIAARPFFQKIAYIGNIPWEMLYLRQDQSLLRFVLRKRHTLIFAPHTPGCNGPGEHAPPPLVNQQPKGRNATLSRARISKHPRSAVAGGTDVKKANLIQIVPA